MSRYCQECRESKPDTGMWYGVALAPPQENAATIWQIIMLMDRRQKLQATKQMVTLYCSKLCAMRRLSRNVGGDVLSISKQEY